MVKVGSKTCTNRSPRLARAFHDKKATVIGRIINERIEQNKPTQTTVKYLLKFTDEITGRGKGAKLWVDEDMIY